MASEHDALRAAARSVLPEVIDAELPSAITSDDPLAGLERLKAIGDRWGRLRAALAAAPAAPEVDVERSGDTYPEGYGCPCCDGTGFVSDEDIDRLRAIGYEVPYAAYARQEAADE